MKANHFAELDEINTIVTDDGISEDWRTLLHDIGIRLKIV